MASRDFDEEFGYTSLQGHEFTLGGYVFHTKSVAPPEAFMALLDDDKSGLQTAVDFIQLVLVNDDVSRFNEVIKATHEFPVSAHQVDQVASWLIREMSGRPTESPSSSGDGGETISSTSKGNLSAVGATGDK